MHNGANVGIGAVCPLLHRGIIFMCFAAMTTDAFESYCGDDSDCGVPVIDLIQEQSSFIQLARSKPPVRVRKRVRSVGGRQNPGNDAPQELQRLPAETLPESQEPMTGKDEGAFSSVSLDSAVAGSPVGLSFMQSGSIVEDVVNELQHAAREAAATVEETSLMQGAVSSEAPSDRDPPLDEATLAEPVVLPGVRDEDDYAALVRSLEQKDTELVGEPASQALENMFRSRETTHEISILLTVLSFSLLVTFSMLVVRGRERFLRQANGPMFPQAPRLRDARSSLVVPLPNLVHSSATTLEFVMTVAPAIKCKLGVKLSRSSRWATWSGVELFLETSSKTHTLLSCSKNVEEKTLADPCELLLAPVPNCEQSVPQVDDQRDVGSLSIDGHQQDALLVRNPAGRLVGTIGPSVRGHYEFRSVKADDDVLTIVSECDYKWVSVTRGKEEIAVASGRDLPSLFWRKSDADDDSLQVDMLSGTDSPEAALLLMCVLTMVVFRPLTGCQ